MRFLLQAASNVHIKDTMMTFAFFFFSPLCLTVFDLDSEGDGGGVGWGTGQGCSEQHYAGHDVKTPQGWERADSRSAALRWSSNGNFCCTHTQHQCPELLIIPGFVALNHSTPLLSSSVHSLHLSRVCHSGMCSSSSAASLWVSAPQPPHTLLSLTTGLELLLLPKCKPCEMPPVCNLLSLISSPLSPICYLFLLAEHTQGYFIKKRQICTKRLLL